MTHQNKSKKDFSRRDFIKISGLTSIAALVLPESVIAAIGSQEAVEKVKFLEQTLPVLNKCDVLIVGGGFAGVTAAKTFAKSGASVVLIERRIFLGREVTATCRPWINHNGLSRGKLPEAIQSCIESTIEQPGNEQTLLRFNHVKLALEDELLKLGVEIIYASYPIQLIAQKDKLQGLVIGNKSGRQAILSKMIVDCTETASVLRLSNIGFQKSLPGLSDFTRTLEFIQIKPLSYRSLAVPAELKMKDNRVLIQQGYLGQNHYYVDCTMDFGSAGFEVESTIDREKEAWKRSMAVTKHLFENVPEFNDALLASSSYSLAGIYSTQMNKPNNGLLLALPEGQFKLNESDPVSVHSFASTYKNLWCINEAARVSAETVKMLLSPEGACAVAEPLAQYLVNYWDLLAAIALPQTQAFDTPVKTNNNPKIKEQASPQKGRAYEQMEVSAQEIPFLNEVDILVVGGGTSGATAAIIAAESGKKTMVIDMNPGFGGTGTYGGVFDYWGHGNYKGFVARHIKNMDKIHQYVQNCANRYIEWVRPFVTWNVQGKMFMLLDEIEKAGAQVVWNSIVIGNIMDGNKATGAVVATPQGIVAVKAKVVIDATGDGDVAAFAGAPFVFGSSSDNVPMWCALCKTSPPGITETAFQITVDVSNIHDYTRAVMVGLRSGKQKHDHYPYLAPRESRHILGDVVVTMTDHLVMREWEDVINIHYGNCDIKGYHSSDWLRMGLIPPNFEIEIPYRALVPKTVENLLVVGKAFSANHESSATVRMQPDLENLGGIAALAAVFALDSGVSVRKINVAALQKLLVQKDLLPVSVLGRNIIQRAYSSEELEQLIKKFNPEKSLHSYSDMELGEYWTERIPLVEVCTSPPALAIPALEKALKQSSGKMALRIAQALAMLGGEGAAQTLHDEIMIQLQANKLPELLVSVKWSDLNKTPPDQAAIPPCGNLIYSLGMTRSKLLIPVLKRVAEIFNPTEIGEFYTNKFGLFHYIDAVSYGAQLLGSTEAIAPLKKMHTNKFLNNRSLKMGIEENFIMERQALLELILGRALARSGSVEGLEVLVEYLDDVRAVLAGFANSTLTKITGKDFGKNKTEWKNWIQSNAAGFKPQPLAERIDG